MSESKDQSVTGVKVIPYLAFNDTAPAIDFYKRAFGAVEEYRIPDDDGKISHAEIRIGGSPIFLSDEYPEIKVFSSQTIGGSPVMIVLEVPDTDTLYHQSVNAGAQGDRPPQDGFDGSLRTAKIIDPFGHRWMFVTRRG